MRRVVLTLLALTVFALAGVAAAASTDPQINTDPIDQAWAESIVLAPSDFGQGWKAEPMPEMDEESTASPSDESWCVEGIPDRSDLIVTGGAASPDFTRSDNASVSAYALVWKTPEQAQAEWDRTLTRMPAFVNCLAAIFGGDGPLGIKIVVTRKGPLTLPAATPRSAAFRIKLAIEETVRVKKKRKKKRTPLANFDLVLVGNGRASVTAFFVSFNPKPFSTAYERSLVEKMAARMATDPTAPAAP
jgi:hypothetical protein